MLQIISGKFFNSDDRYRHDAKGIIFSNYYWLQPIKTCVAALEPVDTYASVASYVINYVNQIEKESQPKPGSIVRTGDSEIIEQFKLLCIFGLRAYFHQNRDSVTITCRQKAYSSSDYHIPSAFVPRYSSNQLRGTVEEVESFISFVSQVIGLSRKHYRVIMTSLRNFAHALDILGHNIDLAYSLLVFSLESLSQNLDRYEPAWDDYHDEVRAKLDPILLNLSSDTSANIKAALLLSTNFKARSRFTNFVIAHVKDTFFLEEAPKQRSALRKCELTRALRNAYNMRSQFTHQLQTIQEHLRYPQIANGDVLRWNHQPYLTIAGMIRLTHHVVMNFIESSVKVDREQINWHRELPNIITMEMAPGYWIWKHEGFKPEHATSKLSGFLSQLESVILTNKSLTDMRELLKIYEGLFTKAKKRLKIQMLSMYFLFNTFVAPENRNQNWEKIATKYKDSFDECTIEAMLTLLLNKDEWTWKPSECDAQWESYQNQCFQVTGLSIPPLLELALVVCIAQSHMKIGASKEWANYLNTAILDAAGRTNVQTLLKKTLDTGVHLNYQDICEAAKKDQVQPSV